MKIEDLLTFNPRLGEGAMLTPQPSIEQILRDHYERLIGKGGDSETLTSAYMAAMVAAASARTPARPQPEEPVRPAPRDAPREKADRAETGQRPGYARPMRDPLDLFEIIGLDVSVAGVDVMRGLRQGSEGGSMMPLATGLAGALLGVIATAERRRG